MTCGMRSQFLTARRLYAACCGEMGVGVEGPNITVLIRGSSPYQSSDPKSSLVGSAAHGLWLAYVVNKPDSFSYIVHQAFPLFHSSIVLVLG